MTTMSEQRSRLDRLTTCDLSDAMERMGVVSSSIRPQWKGAAFHGTALTVWTRAGDNLFVHKALDLLKPGDVLVVNGQGDETRALFGERMATKARNNGARGVVIDGAVRDRDALERLGLPVFARAVTAAGPYKHGPGQLNVPIALGGVVVRPGDLVFGDGDGVVIVPPERLEEIIVLAEAAADMEPLI